MSNKDPNINEKDQVLDLEFDDEILDLQFDDEVLDLDFSDERERNPFVTGGKSLWSALRHQIPAGFAGSGAAALGSVEDVFALTTPEAHGIINSQKEFALESRKELGEISTVINRYQKALDSGQITKQEFDNVVNPLRQRVDFIKGEQFDQYNPGAVENLQKDLLSWALDQQQLGAEYTKDLTNSLDKISDPIDAVNWAFNAVGQAAGHIAPAVATFGTSSVGQEIGSIYLESVIQTAEKHGLTPQEVIEQGLDDSAIAISTGTAAGLLDKLGANKVASSFTKNSMAESLRSRALAMLKTGGFESITEGAQTVIEQVGVDLASQDDIELHKDEIIEAMAQGLVGGTALAGVGETAGAIKEARQRSLERKIADHNATLEDINEAINSDESDVNVASQEAFKEIKDGIEQTSDQLTEPEVASEEILSVGDQTEPGSERAGTTTDITGHTGFQTADQDLEVEYNPPSVISLGEDQNVLTPELDDQVNEAKESYSKIENLQNKKGIASRTVGAFFGSKAQEKFENLGDKAGKFVDDFTSNFETYIGELTENSRALRDQLTNDFVRPVYDVLRNKLSQEDRAATIIKKYARSKEVDSFKMWGYAFMNEIDGASPEFKINELRQSARNRGDQKIIDKTEEFISEFTEKDGDVLNEQETEYYNAFREFMDEGQNLRKQVAKEFFNRDLSLHENYLPKIVEGFTQKNILKKDIAGMDEFLSPEAFFEATGVPGQLRTPPSGRFQLRKGIGDGYYITDFNKVFSRGARDMATDVHLAPAIYKMKGILDSKELQDTIGIDNVSEITDRMHSFINSVKGFNLPSGAVEKEIRNAIAAVKGSYLSDPAQLVKQFVPGAVGIAATYASNPQAVKKGLQMAWKADEEWIRQNAPNLYVRKQSLDHLIESSLSAGDATRKRGRERINQWLNVSDYAISKLLFFTEYAAQGGTLESPNANAANNAMIVQSRAQGTNTLALAPKQFVSQKLWIQVFMAFTMMPLNISRQIFRNINPAKLNNKDRRMMLAMGISNIVIFQAISELVREIYDESRDAFFGEDEEDELFDGVNEMLANENVWKKIAVKSAMDATIGWAPSVISDPVNKYVFDPVRKGIMDEDDFSDPALQIYYGYGNSAWDSFGVIGSFIDDAHKAAEAVVLATESGDEEAMIHAYTYLAEVTATIGSRQAGFAGSAYGPILRVMKEVKKAYRDEYREAVKKMKSREKERKEFRLYQ